MMYSIPTINPTYTYHKERIERDLCQGHTILQWLQKEPWPQVHTDETGSCWKPRGRPLKATHPMLNQEETPIVILCSMQSDLEKKIRSYVPTDACRSYILG